MMEIKLPAMSPTMERGTLAKWLVDEGATVRPGDVIAEIETDKATMELEADEGGTVASILVPGGTNDVAVGTLIAIIAPEGAKVPQPISVGAADGETLAAPQAAGPRLAAGEAIFAPSVRRLVTALNLDTAAITGTGKNGRLTKADVLVAIEEPASGAATSSGTVSKVVERILQVAPLDLGGIRGNGKSGEIVLSDLRRRTSARPTFEVPAVQRAIEADTLQGARPAHEAPTDVPVDYVKLSSMRRTIARRLTDSKREVPHFYLTVDARLDPLLKLRTRLNAALDGRAKLSINDFLIKALALALIEVPDSNVQFAGDELLKFKRADVSVAVAVTGGLVTPVVRQADTKPLGAISNEMRELAEKAREGKLQPSDYAGGTASLSNLGMYGIREMMPVINPPQCLIVGIGSADPRPIVTDGAIAVGRVSSITASFDHRAVDGAVGAAFLTTLKRLIEDPFTMLA